MTPKTLLLFMMFLVSCSGGLRDPQDFGSGDSVNGTVGDRPTPYPSPTGTPGTGGDGVGGECYEVPSLGRTCDADGSIFGTDSGVITVQLLNFNGGEAIRGGGSYFIRYRTGITYEKFKSVYSKIEFKKQSESEWKLIADKITSNDQETVEYEWKVCPHIDNENCERDTSDNLVSVNGSDFQIRVTSFRLPTQSGTVTSSGIFKIDSDPPVLATFSNDPKQGFTMLSEPGNGFINLELYGATDNLSSVRFLCLKTNTTIPLESDACWVPSAAFKPVVTSVPSSTITSMTILSLPLFFGYTIKSGLPYYLWLKDSSGNVSVLTETVVDETTTYGLEKKDKLVLSQSSAVSYSSRDAYWQPISNPLTPSFTAGLGSKTTPSADIYFGANDHSYLADPGSLVITSAGVAFIKNPVSGASGGILKFDLNSGTYSVFIPQGNHAAGTAGSGATARVNDPYRIALDANEDLLIMDKKENGTIVISKVTSVTGTTPQVTDVIGGGSTTTSGDMAASSLQIEDSENLRWYGTFMTLPNGSLVFSSDDPIRPLNPDTGNRFRLRVYRPERTADAQIQTLAMNSVDASTLEATTSEGHFIKDLEAYGSFVVSYDSEKRDIGRIYGRACSPTGVGINKTCLEIVNLVFDRSGNYLSLMASQGPWLWGNEILAISKRNNLLSMNSYRGRLSSLTGGSLNGAWTDLLTDQGRGSSYCANGLVAGQCSVQIRDFFLTSDERIFFIDNQRLRFIDDDGTIQSILSFN